MIRRVVFCSHLISEVKYPLIRLKRHCVWSSIHGKWCHQDSKTDFKAGSSLDSADADTKNILKPLERNKGSNVKDKFISIYRIAKSQPSTINILRSEPYFTDLCQKALTQVRHFDSDETIAVLRTLTFLSVPLNCTLGQATLQMLRHYINELSLKDISFVLMLLEKQTGNIALIKPLRKALSMALEEQLLFSIGLVSVQELANGFRLAIEYNLKLSTIERLSSELLHNTEALSDDQILECAVALSNLNSFPPTIIDFANELKSRIIESASMYSKLNIRRLIYALSRCNILHTSQLLSILSHRCVTELWDLEETSRLLSVFNKHNCLSSELLDWTIECLKREPETLRNNKRMNLITVFQALSEANHNIDRTLFLELIRSCKEKLNNMEKGAPHRLVKLAMHLVVLECIPPELLERVFHTDFILQAIKCNPEYKPDVLQCYLTLEQAARLEPPSGFNGPFLPADLLKEAILNKSQVTKPIDYTLKEFLEVGLGGPQFMLTGLWTKWGHFMDHVLVMRKEDFPVTLNIREPLQAVPNSQGLQFIEDVVLPENAKVLAVLVARQEWFNKDPPSLRGLASFQQRILKKMGYNPIILGPPKQTEEMQDIDCRMENKKGSLKAAAFPK